MIRGDDPPTRFLSPIRICHTVNRVKHPARSAGRPGLTRLCGTLAVLLVLGCGDSGAEPSLFDEGWVAVTAGTVHACALHANGEAYCWGGNLQGQFGDASSDDAVVPTRAGGSLLFQSLRAAGDHTCGVTTAGEAYCWGRNDVGELGIGTPFPTPVPTRIEGGVYDQVYPSFYSGCGTRAGVAECWGGSRWEGSLAIPISDGCLGLYAVPTWPCARAPVPLRGETAFESIDSGLFFGCGIAITGGAYCWGMDDFGQLGADGAQNCVSGSAVASCATVPTAVLGGEAFVDVAAGDVHACAVDAGGTAYCWGRVGLTVGQVGAGSREGVDLPTPVAGGLTYRGVYASRTNDLFGHSCGITNAREAWCWGADPD